MNLGEELRPQRTNKCGRKPILVYLPASRNQTLFSVRLLYFEGPAHWFNYFIVSFLFDCPHFPIPRSSLMSSTSLLIWYPLNSHFLFCSARNLLLSHMSNLLIIHVHQPWNACPSCAILWYSTSPILGPCFPS